MTLVNQAKTKAARAAATADNYQRKFNELRYAIAFEHKYSKDWILERYLNIAYFGDGAYGIEAAARHYFDKPASALTLREAALLAGMVKNPTGYDPTNYPEPRQGAPRHRAGPDGRAQRHLRHGGQPGAGQAVRPGRGRRRRNGCVASRTRRSSATTRPATCSHDPALGQDRRRAQGSCSSAVA